MHQNRVFDHIQDERLYQDLKWGAKKPQSLPGYLLIMQSELQEAIDGWMKDREEPRQSTLEEILQVVAVGVACLETYGVRGSAISTNDISLEERED